MAGGMGVSEDDADGLAQRLKAFEKRERALARTRRLRATIDATEDSLRQAIIEAVDAGADVKAACAAGGISRTTFYKWRKERDLPD